MEYTVLVVEDEENQREALLAKVDWASAGFTVAGSAENGVEALDMVETLEPDLIITDIKMPMINGIQLAARVREIRPATQVVFLSGYDSFEYARSAIDYNVISYLLKPVSPAEMSRELFGIRKRMDERTGLNNENTDAAEELKRLKISEFLLPLLLGGYEKRPNKEIITKTAEQLGIIENGECCFGVVITELRDDASHNKTSYEHLKFINSVISRYTHCVSVLAYGRAVTLVTVSGELSKALELPLRELVQSAKKVFSLNCTVGVSREFSDLSDCSDAYMQAVTARRYTSDGTGEVRFIADREKDSNNELENVEKSVVKLEQMLKVGSSDSVSDLVSELYENSTPDSANLLVVQIIAAVYRVVSTVANKSDIAELLASNPIIARITTSSSEKVMTQELVDFCTQAKNIISQTQRRETEILCDKVVQIINENYSDEELSLTGVSGMLAISPNYLSALIKKTKGKNFITLLTERRMQAAYDMLVCSTMKVLEISEKCGYSDQHYFSYCFKKFYGESPNKIRATKRENGGDDN